MCDKVIISNNTMFNQILYHMEIFLDIKLCSRYNIKKYKLRQEKDIKYNYNQENVLTLNLYKWTCICMYSGSESFSYIS